MPEPIALQSREALLKDWYLQLFPKVAAYIQRQGGDLEDAKEVFQESLIAYYEKQTLEKFQPRQSDEAYLFGIAKKKWLTHQARRQRLEEIGAHEIQEDPQEKPVAATLLAVLKQTSERCLNLLQAFYYENQSMQTLAQRFGYTSIRSATVQKYKCLEKVRDQVKQYAMTYEDFLS
ncbi:MAG: RNA polymerase sigma factor [Salibacteraceae bacterium]